MYIEQLYITAFIMAIMMIIAWSSSEKKYPSETKFDEIMSSRFDENDKYMITIVFILLFLGIVFCHYFV